MQSTLRNDRMVHKKKEMLWVDRQMTCKERGIGQPKPITKWYNKKQKEKWVDKVVSNATVDGT